MDALTDEHLHDPNRYDQADKNMTDKDTELLKCSICGQQIVPHVLSGWRNGNNAQPLNNGRCCDDCDNEIVIPARIRLILRQRQQQPK